LETANPNQSDRIIIFYWIGSQFPQELYLPTSNPPTIPAE